MFVASGTQIDPPPGADCRRTPGTIDLLPFSSIPLASHPAAATYGRPCRLTVPCGAHQPLAAPEGHHHGAAAQHSAQVADGALFCPEGVLAKQPLQLQQAAAGATSGSETQHAQAWGTGGMTNQTEPHGGIQHKNQVSPAVSRQDWPMVA